MGEHWPMHIAESINKRADELVNAWNAKAASCPLLQLDKTWPSIGVLDQLTFGLRRKPKFTDSDLDLLRAVSSYICMIAAEAWDAMGVDVEAFSGQYGAALRAATRDEGKELCVINVEAALGKLLSGTPGSFPVLGSFERTISPTYNYLSLFSVGVATGLSPFAEGPWSSETPDTFKDNIEAALRVLARSSAKHYERLYPDEMTGQVAELYLHKLIYPPACMDEPLPALGAVKSLLPAMKEFGMRRKSALAFAQNLAQSPDEVMSGAGLALYSALAEGDIDPRVAGAAEARGTAAGLYRLAMIEARMQFELPGDWIYQTEFDDSCRKRFEIEKELGFLPWCYLTPRTLEERKKDARVGLLTEALTFFNYQKAVELLELLLKEQPGHLELRLQRTYLHILAGEFDKAYDSVRATLDEPGLEDDARPHSLKGLCEMCLGEPAKALISYEHAYQLRTPGKQSVSIANDYGWALINAKRHAEALPVLQKALADKPDNLTVLLNIATCHRTLGKETETRVVNDQCLSLAPFDRRVFRAAFS